MNGSPEATRQNLNPIPPRVGNILVLSATTVSATQDCTVFAGMFVEVHAEGGDVYINFASTNTNTADATITTGNNRTSRIPKDNSKRIRLHKGTDIFMAYVTKSGTATVRIEQSSEASLG
jgi:hypothetical protein